MAFNSDGYSYEMPWRQNFEARATLGYLAGIVAAGVCSVTTPIPRLPFCGWELFAPHPGLGVQWVLIASGEESNF